MPSASSLLLRALPKRETLSRGGSARTDRVDDVTSEAGLGITGCSGNGGLAPSQSA
jgi:hypothetical protein